ncbi:hypothetical protein [Pseudomonas aeruginosa]|uniref:hypothetical protein n=1 Tax=Pseudomonas aeruginosa TaxID=287 RepID=UPI0035A87A59
MNRIHSENPLLWLCLLLLAWAVLGVQLATPKVASGPFYAATEHHLGVTRWEAAPRLGLDAWTTNFASGDTVGAKGTGTASTGAESALNASRLNMQLAAEQVAGSKMPAQITGYSKHGLNQAISRDGVGVAPQAITDAVSNPIKISGQSGGRFVFTGKNAVVVVNSQGKVITTWATSSAGTRAP